jgi:hypothetical protein
MYCASVWSDTSFTSPGPPTISILPPLLVIVSAEAGPQLHRTIPTATAVVPSTRIATGNRSSGRELR